MPQYFLTIPHDTAESPTMESMAAMDPAELEALVAEVEAFDTAPKRPVPSSAPAG